MLNKKCVKCGDTLKWGDFAFHQEICWYCFNENFKEIIELCQTREQKIFLEDVRLRFKEMYIRNS